MFTVTQTFRWLFHQKCANAFVLLRLVCCGKDDHGVGDWPVCDPSLCAIQHPARSPAHSGGHNHQDTEVVSVMPICNSAHMRTHAMRSISVRVHSVAILARRTRYICSIRRRGIHASLDDTATQSTRSCANSCKGGLAVGVLLWCTAPFVAILDSRARGSAGVAAVPRLTESETSCVHQHTYQGGQVIECAWWSANGHVTRLLSCRSRVHTLKDPNVCHTGRKGGEENSPIHTNTRMVCVRVF